MHSDGRAVLLLPIQRALGAWVFLSALVGLEMMISAWPASPLGWKFGALHTLGVGLSAVGLTLQLATAVGLLTLQPVRFGLAYATILFSLVAANPIVFVPAFGAQAGVARAALTVAGNLAFLLILVAVHARTRREPEARTAPEYS